MKQFKSKRNQVYLDADQNMVFKIFTNHHDYLKEVAVYHQLRDMQFIPRLLFYKDDQIGLEYLSYPTLLDELERQEKEGYDFHVWRLLFDQLSICKKQYNLLPAEPHLRNFLFDQKNIYFLDFEQYDDFSLEECYQRVIAYIMLYDPIDTNVKLKIMYDLVNLYHLDLMMIKEEINHIKQRVL